jgi:hypothetical protein
MKYQTGDRVSQATNIATSKQKVKCNITLTIGVFFDGTGNNAANTESILQACGAGYHDLNFAGADALLAQCARDNFGLSGSEATSYTGYYTNIHWLSKLYSQHVSVAEQEAQSALYVGGIGTEAGKPDNGVGLGLGVAETGVVAKTDKAVSEIAGKIQDMLRTLQLEQPGCPLAVKALRFDIFGFSRGAAAARHFASRIQSEDSHVIRAISQGMGGVEFQGMPAGQNRFIGLFDTVAAIGTPANGMDPHNADTGDAVLTLRPGVADRVFQIAAANECRFNFALNSISPAWPELVLPGAHSDTGGGYLPVMNENVFLTRPGTETVPLSRSDEQTRVYQRALAQLPALRLSPRMAPLVGANKITAEAWYDDRMPPDRYGQMQKRSYAALTLRNRIVKNDWSKVVLRVMLDAAWEAGVKFNAIDPNFPDTALPDELTALSVKALAMGKAARAGQPVPAFSPQEMEMLATKYIHCSAHWNTVTTRADGRIRGGALPSELIGFINRPEEQWRRTIYDMDGREV